MIVALFAAAILNRSVQLLDVARPMFTVGRPELSLGDYTVPLSDSAALVLHEGQVWEARVYNRGASTSSRVIPLEKVVNSFPDGARSPCASPDGRWVAWYSDGDILVTSTNSAQSFKVDQPQRCFLMWTQDSRHLVQLIGSTASSTITTGIDNDIAEGGRAEPLTFSGGISSYSEPLAMLSTHQVLLGVVPSPRSSPELDLVNFSASTPRAIRLHYDLPQGAKVVQAASSPDGTRICWLLESSLLPGWMDWLRSRIRGSASEVYREWSIWVSDVGDDHTAEIGSIQGGSNSDHIPSDIQWTPSGKHVCFAYSNRLWLAPAPRR